MPDQHSSGLSPYRHEMGSVVEGLERARRTWRASHSRHAEHGAEFPSRQALSGILRQLRATLFPLRSNLPGVTEDNENAWVEATLDMILSQLSAQIALELRATDPQIGPAEEGRKAEAIVRAFAASLPAIRAFLDEDIEAGYANDPAARSVDEVLIFYPALTAIIHYRLAHRLLRLGAPLNARIITEIAHSETGIDIHPGAEIGRSFFIDHGTGVVIGETTRIGERVRLFQGVTLGGEPSPAGTAHVRKGRGTRRHPVIEDDVVIFPGAVILGPVTIGARTQIGGNICLRRDVPPDSLVEAAEPPITRLPATAAGDARR